MFAGDFHIWNKHDTTIRHGENFVPSSYTCCLYPQRCRTILHVFWFHSPTDSSFSFMTCGHQIHIHCYFRQHMVLTCSDQITTNLKWTVLELSTPIIKHPENAGSKVLQLQKSSLIRAKCPQYLSVLSPYWEALNLLSRSQRSVPENHRIRTSPALIFLWHFNINPHVFDGDVNGLA